MVKKEVQSLFISDIHLGTLGSKTEHLIKFIDQYDPKKIYLIGDIIDGWRIKCRFYWNSSHTEVLYKLLDLSRQGVEIIWISGNHDEFLRKFSHYNIKFDNIWFKDEEVYLGINGKKYWIVHGDVFDGVIKYSGVLGHLGDRLYNVIISINHLLNSCRKCLGLKYWSLNYYVKQRTKQAVQYISSYSDAVSKGTKAKGCDGVICGHIHCAEIKDINGIEYLNTGDWVDSCSGIIEHLDGTFELVEVSI